MFKINEPCSLTIPMIDPRHSTQGLSVPGRWQGLRSRWCAWGWAESQASRCRGGDEDAGRSLLPSLGLEPLPRAPPWTGVWGKRPTLGLARTAAPQNPPAPGLFPAVALPERARESTQSLPYVLPSRTPRVQSKYSPSSRGQATGRERQPTLAISRKPVPVHGVRHTHSAAPEVPG